MEPFSKAFPNIFPLCCRVHKQDIEAEFQRKVNEVQQLKKDTDKQSDLAQQMEEFFEVGSGPS